MKIGRTELILSARIIAVSLDVDSNKLGKWGPWNWGKLTRLNGKSKMSKEKRNYV